MKLTKSSWKIISQKEGIVGMKQHCEYAGRICYASTDKMTDTSYKDLLKVFEERGHYSPLGHGTVYMLVPKEKYTTDFVDRLTPRIYKENGNETYMDRFINEIWTRCIYNAGFWYITTNYRLIKELEMEDLLEKYWSEPQCFHEKRYSVELTCSRAIADEIMRHGISLVPCCQSSRYCNFSKDKFNNEVAYTEPSWFETATEKQKEIYLSGCECSERSYLSLINEGMKAEQARDMLGLNVQTTLILTGFAFAWEYVFSLRTTKAAHPDMVAIMKPLATEFKTRGFITKEYE